MSECTECGDEIGTESFEALGHGTFCSIACLKAGTPDGYPFKKPAMSNTGNTVKQITTEDLQRKAVKEHLEEWLSDNEENENSECPWTAYEYSMLKGYLAGLKQSEQNTE